MTGNLLRIPIAMMAVALCSAAAGAQSGTDVPKDMRPPAGMCRIWLEGVPPAQQPAPTSCPQAVRTRPDNGRVIWGDEPAGSRTSPTRSFTEPRKDEQAPEPKAQPRNEPTRVEPKSPPRTEPRQQPTPRTDPPRIEPRPAPTTSPPPRAEPRVVKP